MTADPENVTQIPTTSKGAKPRKAARALVLDDPHTEDGFTNLDVIRGLYGVALALDETDPSDESSQWLESAARVLAAILHHRAM